MRNLALLPGFLCDRTVWLHQIEALSGLASISVIEWGPQHDSIISMAEEVLRSAPPKFALAGHSMGGRVAFQVCRIAPDRVEKVALFNTGADTRPPGEAGVQEEINRRKLLTIAQTQGMRAMSIEWLKGMIPPYRQTDTPLVEEIIQMFERKTPRDMEIQMLALLNRPDARPVLQTIKCPTLVLTGRDDVWSTPVRHEEIAAAIPGAQLVLVPQCGHMSTMERPEAVAEVMHAWL